ncbi:hypothetical protein HN51_052196 [Arachis hypogaea]
MIIGIARGLKYLHTKIEPQFTISELNSSAVYLTEEFSPKVCMLTSSNLIFIALDLNCSWLISKVGRQSLKVRKLPTCFLTVMDLDRRVRRGQERLAQEVEPAPALPL